ncbi:hypothetical protein [Cupriavidus sp. D39]|uniref:hypothetical protein n=1 Tax=Cupriavidus sp. D39 TaxID=2997877 RepID=UPI00226E059B|nr:hypothetical protein [Cupriavidus sp. D39]MCY0855951.1 hypothetical protein [Cupriavidus sp. D39]
MDLWHVYLAQIAGTTVVFTLIPILTAICRGRPLRGTFRLSAVRTGLMAGAATCAGNWVADYLLM